MILADIDDCNPDACKNGGSCLDGVNSYTCICAAGYTGPNCNISEYIVYLESSHSPFLRDTDEQAQTSNISGNVDSFNWRCFGLSG